MQKPLEQSIQTLVISHYSPQTKQFDCLLRTENPFTIIFLAALAIYTLVIMCIPQTGHFWPVLHTLAAHRGH